MPQNANTETDEALTPRKRNRHPPLRSISDVTRELARLYWAARRGEVDVTDASKLGNLLANLGRLVQGVELEARIEALEAQATVERNGMH